MNRYLVKIAEIASKPTARSRKEKPAAYEAKLREHTLRVLDRLDKENGIVANHGLGSGKTLLALAAIHRAQKADPKGVSHFIAPAPLINNFYKEVEKHKVPLDMSRVKAMSYEKALRNKQSLAGDNVSLMILDEAHKVRNTGTKRYKEIRDLSSLAKKRLLLTGTSTYNRPHDIAPLINIAAGEEVLPTDHRKFEEKFLGQSEIKRTIMQRLRGVKPLHETVLKNEQELRDILNKHVDIHDPKTVNPEDFPTKSEKIVEVKMSNDQHRVYKYLEGALPWHLRLKVRQGLPLDKKESEALNSFSSGVRQASNHHSAFSVGSKELSPKVTAIAKSISDSAAADKNFRGVIYSNFLEAGVHPISSELTRLGIKHQTFTGGISDAERKKIVDAYNSGKNSVLLLSSSGGEGLDLKGTKKVIVSEPHFNRSKIDQVVGRGVRYHSHHHLPEKERRVEVEHYHSVFPDGYFGPSRDKSIDQYLHINSGIKAEVGGKVLGLSKNRP